MKRTRVTAGLDNPYYRSNPRPLKRAISNATADKIAARNFVSNAMQVVAAQSPRQYVPRTPGGNVIADNHYMDAEKSNTAIAVLGTSWAGTELDATQGAGGATTMNCLFAPIEGNDIGNRDGRKVFVKKIRITGALIVTAQTAQSTLDIPTRVRLVLYCDKQTNKTQSQGEDVIHSGDDVVAINMFQNTANFGRFKIYKDKVFTLVQNSSVAATDAGTTIVQGGTCRPFKMVCSPNCWVNYAATNGGTVADVVDNSFHLIGLCDNASAAPVIQYKVRTTFTP